MRHALVDSGEGGAGGAYQSYFGEQGRVGCAGDTCLAGSCRHGGQSAASGRDDKRAYGEHCAGPSRWGAEEATQSSLRLPVSQKNMRCKCRGSCLHDQKADHGRIPTALDTAQLSLKNRLHIHQERSRD